MNARRFASTAALAALILLAGCVRTTTPPTIRPTDTPSAPTVTATHTLMPVCTPPPCTPGHEVYYCPDECPGGCGTECATPTPLPATATPHPSAATMELRGPLLVDSIAGRLYAAGWAEGMPTDVGNPAPTHVFALSAEDGRLLAVYDIGGTIGLDSRHGWLYVDEGVGGLTVLDAATGERLQTIALPPNADPWQRNPAPVADPAAGTVLAFRNNIAYMVNPESGAIVREIAFDVPPDGGSCGVVEGPLAIERAVYDPDHRILYAAFVTYVCTPWVSYTIASYDVEASAEIGRSGMLPFAATAHDGRLYGSSWYRMGIGYRWVWQDGEPWLYSSGWSGGGANALQVDAVRGWLYESTESSLRVLDSETMMLLFVARKPAEGSLVGFDPATDNLYFLTEEGRLRVVGASAIQPPGPEAPVPTAPPAVPVRALLASPGWPDDPTLFGIWGDEIPTGECYVLNQTCGMPLVSIDGGAGWAALSGGLPERCACLSTVAVSPDYAADGTLLAGVAGLGAWRSEDGGHLWQPSGAGLDSMAVQQILLSPGFAHDGTAFARALDQLGDALYRSIDGGLTWQPVDANLYLLAMSPEFDQDGTLMGAARLGDGSSGLRISRDGGETWQNLGGLPDGGTIVMLSMAPLFQEWETVFALSSTGTLYRSWIGGSHWESVFQAAPGAAWAEMAYGPQEENRPVFLAVAVRGTPDPASSVDGMLYRSGDGGMTWARVSLPDDVQPTALAVPPDFAEEGLLFLGTGDGQVLVLPVGE